MRIVSFHTHVNGNAGWDWADFHVTPADKSAAPFTFKILFLWERVDGEWWCKGDMYLIDKSAAATTQAHAHRNERSVRARLTEEDHSQHSSTGSLACRPNASQRLLSPWRACCPVRSLPRKCSRKSSLRHRSGKKVSRTSVFQFLRSPASSCGPWV